MERDLDRQVDHLTTRLRENGLPPERDLWPDIDQAIDRTERTWRRRPRLWQFVAVAASLVLLVGMGMMGGVIFPTAERPWADAAPSAALSSSTNQNGLAAVDQAWKDLQSALELDPNNTDLSRLVLLMHRSRGQLIRLRARDLAGPGR